jgi:hypothetical protein
MGMDVSIHYLNEERKINRFHFTAEGLKEECIDINELNQYDADLMIIDQVLEEDQEADSFVQLLKNEEKITPTFTSDKAPFDMDHLSQQSPDEVLAQVNKIQRHWVTQNNLQSVETLPQILKHMALLWSNDRDQFFQEVWQFFKLNLNARELRLVFHDLNQTPSKDEQTKLQLTTNYLFGTKNPELQEGGQVEQELLERYQESIPGIFSVAESRPEKNELVCAFNIQHGPFLLMAKCKGINALQLALFKALVSGLNQS